jgi:uncharacterized protein (DUF952 family)
MAVVLHLIPLADWQGLGPEDAVTSPSLDTEGFIHCTDDAEVLLKVANAFYTSVPGDFAVLDVDVDQLTSRCVWEAPAHVNGGSASFAPRFPHVYGTIDRAAVIAVRNVVRDQVGAFVGYA